MEEDEPVRIPVTDEFDLHTVPPCEVKAVVENFLEEAHLAGFKVPSKLYIRNELPRNPSGKILKRVLRQELADTNAVTR